MASIRVRRASDGAQYITPIVATKPSTYAVRVRNSLGALVGYGMLSTTYPGHFTLRSIIGGVSYYLVNPETFLGAINVRVPGLSDTPANAANTSTYFNSSSKVKSYATGVQTSNIYTFPVAITGNILRVGINVSIRTTGGGWQHNCSDHS